jgi:hypothetical protein
MCAPLPAGVGRWRQLPQPAYAAVEPSNAQSVQHPVRTVTGRFQHVSVVSGVFRRDLASSATSGHQTGLRIVPPDRIVRLMLDAVLVRLGRNAHHSSLLTNAASPLGPPQRTGVRDDYERMVDDSAADGEAALDRILALPKRPAA